MARIIVVIDDPNTANALEEQLKQFGFAVEVVPSSTDALRALRHRPADAVLVDLDMPTMDGFALLRARAKDAALTDVPVVALTSTAEGASAARKFAPYACLKKPLGPLQIVETFQRLTAAPPAG